MNVVYTSGLFNAKEYSTRSKPDEYRVNTQGKPEDSFVLCRDENGKPTAIYGDDTWDFNPYRLSASRVSVINFLSGVAPSDIDKYRSLISEIKYLIFCLLYFTSNGQKGRLTPSTLYNYYTIIRKAARYCLEMRKRPLVGRISLKELLSNTTYLASFCMENSESVSFNKKMPALLAHLAYIGEDITGVSIVPHSAIEFKNKDSKQHPVIPTRIYLDLMGALEESIDHIYEYSEQLGSFIRGFENSYFGMSHLSQRKLGVGGRRNHQPDIKEAIALYGLDNLFVGRLKIPERRYVSAVLLKIQFIVKNIIHLYTGMRNEEVMRLPYDCLESKTILDEVWDDKGTVKDKARVISLISTTTKFTGFKKRTSWFAPECVIKALVVAQKISQSLNDLLQCDTNKRMLFVSPTYLGRALKDVQVTSFNKVVLSSMIDVPVIKKGDFDELLASDPSRNFQEEPAFQIGQPWPLTSHQFRRSLAFYGSNSGFLSLPTIKRQFKHLSLDMSRYYSNNFENLKTIFGFYDDNKQEYVLPDGHMAFEYQMGMPINMAEQIIADVLGEDSQLFGKTGGYIERQKKKLDEGAISILEIRKDTEKRIAKGDLSYRSTLLGGCTKIGACDTAMLGEFTECLTCEGSIIKLDLVEKQIEATKAELAMYDEGSCEFEVVCQDLNKLKQYQAKVISREVLE